MAGVEWGRRPIGKDGLRSWKLRRVPAGGKVDILIMSHDMVGTHIHFVGNRTRPCTGSDCECCGRGHAPRWKGYLAGIDLKTQEKIMIEFTANVAQRVAAWFDQHRTLKGSTLRLFRKGKASNGELLSKMEPPAIGQGDLEQAPDVRPMLQKMWEITHVVEPAKPLFDAPRLAPTGTDDETHHID